MTKPVTLVHEFSEHPLDFHVVCSCGWDGEGCTVWDATDHLSDVARDALAALTELRRLASTAAVLCHRIGDCDETIMAFDRLCNETLRLTSGAV
jgi:hypothetical protein